MMKIKKAQDGFMTKAACRRGVCGKGSVSDKRAARMDRKDARRLDKETRKEEKQYEKEQRREEKYWRRSNLKKGGSIKKTKKTFPQSKSGSKISKKK